MGTGDNFAFEGDLVSGDSGVAADAEWGVAVPDVAGDEF
jgi:hypothetical protein